MDSWQVWDVRRISARKECAGKAPIGGRWVDHNKCDEASPDVRSRRVAKDIACWKDDAMFAATPFGSRAAVAVRPCDSWPGWRTPASAG
eukprot:10763529-Alexandrium_andersonii.AAC.1